MTPEPMPEPEGPARSEVSLDFLRLTPPSDERSGDAGRGRLPWSGARGLCSVVERIGATPQHVRSAALRAMLDGEANTRQRLRRSGGCSRRSAPAPATRSG
jgi:hypothetical protein